MRSPQKMAYKILTEQKNPDAASLSEEMYNRRIIWDRKRRKPSLCPVLLVANRIYCEFSGLLFLFVLNTSLAKVRAHNMGHWAFVREIQVSGFP